MGQEVPHMGHEMIFGREEKGMFLMNGVTVKMKMLDVLSRVQD